MALREDIYAPIPGDNPAGRDIRYSAVYDKIKEARREDEDLDQGIWKRERKVADYGSVVKLVQDAIATESKDVQLAVWLTEALLHLERFDGLEQGLACCRELIARFGGRLFPPTEEGDLEPLAAPLEWLNVRLEIPIKSIPLNSAGHNWYRFKESRLVGYEESAKDANQKKLREKALREGKLAAEDFDRSFVSTEKIFYASNEKTLDRILASVALLEETSHELLGDLAPSFVKLSSAVQEVGHVIHQLLEKKRGTEPDPVEPPPEATIELETPMPAGRTIVQPAVSPHFTPDVLDRRNALDTISEAAHHLREQDRFSPAPYLMLRGLRWGELRRASALNDPKMLEAPPSEVRCQVKCLAVDGKWAELLELAERLMAFPFSRAWLDLQRFVVEACVALGPEFDAIARGIRSELRALVRDLPELLDATLLDDTAAANAETRSWLRELSDEPGDSASVRSSTADYTRSDSFRKKFVDPFSLATTAMRTGDEQRAFEIMREEIARQQSGRGRFFRRLQFVQLCVSAKREMIAQPILDDLLASADAHKIEDWEDREIVAEALATIMVSSKRIQGDAKEKQKYFERICRLDPVKALSILV